MEVRIIKGPADCANRFGHFRKGLIPAEKYACVIDAEYSNGGYGPMTLDGLFWTTEESAHRGLERFCEQSMRSNICFSRR